MEPQPHDGVVVDSLTLRFIGQDRDGTALHELRAAHVAEVLQGVVGLTGDFSRAGAFGDGPGGGEILVRPPQEGSFVMEVVREVFSDPSGTATAIAAGAGAVGVPTLSQVIWWATKSARADVADFDYLDDGTVKVVWQDGTAEPVPRAAWDELQKRKRRRKKYLRQIMAPLSDERVTGLEVSDQEPVEDLGGAPTFQLSRPDYDAMRPDDEIEEAQDIFDVEARMSAINFDDPQKWRVKTKDVTRSATVEDEDFLGSIALGRPIRASDTFRLRLREDIIIKNGRTSRKWTVLKVESHRRAAHDDDS